MSAVSPPARLLVFADDAAFYAKALRERLGPTPVIVATSDRAEAREALAGSDALVAMASRVNDEFLSAGPQLRWIHSLTSGVETLLGSRVLPCDCIVTSSRGIHGPQMAEMALLMMMSLARDLPRMFASQAASRWDRWQQPLLAGKHAVLVGVGAIAESMAPVLKTLGMRVTGIQSRARAVPGFDALHTREALPEVLASADFVIVLLPLEEGTRGFFDAARLALLPPHACLVNLSRGGVVDESALVEALQAGRIAGASMDVFVQEPLPASSPLWRTPRLIVTPHVGGWSDVYSQQSLAPLLANAQALSQGLTQALVNRVR